MIQAERQKWHVINSLPTEYAHWYCVGFCVPGNLNDRLDFAASSWEQHAGIIAKPATLLFKALNVSPAPLREEERPKLLAGPLLTALGLQGKLEAGKVNIYRLEQLLQYHQVLT